MITTSSILTSARFTLHFDSQSQSPGSVDFIFKVGGAPIPAQDMSSNEWVQFEHSARKMAEKYLLDKGLIKGLAGNLSVNGPYEIKYSVKPQYTSKG